MKRILSLILVLVMVLGVMPMASAANCEDGQHVIVNATCTAPQTCSVEGCEWRDGSELGHDYAEATCTAPKTCKREDCDATEGDPLGHDYAEATCTAPKTCKREGCNATDGEPLPHKDELNGTVAGKDYICDVCQAPMSTQVAVTAAASKSTLIVGESTTVNLSYTTLPQGGSVTGGEWSSSDASIASVSNGTVTAHKKGTVTITVSGLTPSSGITLVEPSASVQITVKNGGVIECASDATSASSYSLRPALKVNGIVQSGAVFEYSTTTAGATVSTGGIVTSTKSQIVDVVVKLVSHADIENIADVEPITVSISFYDVVDAEVKLNAKKTTFDFEELDVFSSVTINRVAQSNAKYYSMSHLWSGVDYDTLMLTEITANGTTGKLSYSNSSHYTDVFNEVYGFVQVPYLSFTSIKEGTFSFMYELRSDGLTVRYGTITMKVTSGSSDITYNTSFAKSVTLDEDDFANFYKKAEGGTLDYVHFDITSLTPAMGTLFTKADQKTAVAANTAFQYQAKTTDLYDLDTVTYVPWKYATESYEDTVPFTCYGTDGDYVSGIMTIKVGGDMNFTDVKESDYFYDAVVWAVNNDITSGLSATTFGPNNTCTRAQVVTFLYRAAGEPDVSGSLPFTDVKYTDYYYDAVLWAYKNDITTGLTATTFGPNSTVTRGQVVTFLWRAMGEDEVSASNPFTDVKRSDYYYEAVLWAVKNDVTTGLTSTTFGPNSGCTRGQIVTFLYRAYEGE